MSSVLSVQCTFSLSFCVECSVANVRFCSFAFFYSLAIFFLSSSSLSSSLKCPCHSLPSSTFGDLPHGKCLDATHLHLISIGLQVVPLALPLSFSPFFPNHKSQFHSCYYFFNRGHTHSHRGGDRARERERERESPWVIRKREKQQKGCISERRETQSKPEVNFFLFCPLFLCHSLFFFPLSLCTFAL